MSKPDPEDMPEYDCPFCDEAMYLEARWGMGGAIYQEKYHCEACGADATKRIKAKAADDEAESK